MTVDELRQVPIYVRGTQVNLTSLQALFTILENAFGKPQQCSGGRTQVQNNHTRVPRLLRLLPLV